MFDWIANKLEPYVGYAEAGWYTMWIVIFACIGVYVLTLLLYCI